ncbi:MAG: DNA polymerase I [Lachnospiraceae bacterium]|nr:DNA polymerase I [Lachnospiraceae bacterium]
MEKVVLIDGHSILHRAFYGVPDLTNGEGLHTNAVYGFLNILFKILEEEQPDYLAVAFDVHAPTFRHEKYAAYKGTRKPMPEELREQVPVMKEVLHAMQIATVEKAGLEADDILGTLAKRAEADGKEITLVSGDRDLLQIATDKILVRLPKTSKGQTVIENYHTPEVIGAFGVTPSQIIDLKGLMGDSSDNIPGVPGIGPKTAAKILAEFGTVENAIAHVDEVTPPKAQNNLREFADQALLSKDLATIKTDCDLAQTWDDLKVRDFYNQESYDCFTHLGFQSFLKRFDGRMGSDDAAEETFRSIVSAEEADAWFTSLFLKRPARLGLSLLADREQLCALSLCRGEETVCLPVQGGITASYLAEQIGGLLASGLLIACMDVKKLLWHIEASEKDPLYDCGIADYLVHPLRGSYRAEEVAADYGLTQPSREQLLGKSSDRDAWEKSPEEAARFLCYEASTAFRLVPALSEKLESLGMTDLFRDIEMPLVHVLYGMEAAGIRCDREALRRYGERLNGRILQLEQEIYDLAGETFNINSPKQLGVILFEKLLLPFGKKTKTGYSTSADVLEKLKCEHPIVEKVLDYRQYTKLKSTYADGLAAFIDPRDERIHGSFHQTITATGRLSSTDPNLQNIPVRVQLGREIRKVFVPADGCVFVDADYSQIELRILAAMSGDPALIDAYHQDQDIHRITASKVFHVPFDEVTPEMRSNAKAVNFGIVYGISSFGLGNNLSISRKEAEEYIQSYFATYPGVKRFLDGLVAQGKEQGYVTSLYHRIRPIPELSSANFMQRQFGERVAMNSPIQGTAADIMKIAMIRVARRLREEKLSSRLLLQIHDELLIEAKAEEKEQVADILREEMMSAAHLAVPLEVSVKEGSDWYEAK